MLGATARDTGLLQTAQTLPFLLLSIPLRGDGTIDADEREILDDRPQEFPRHDERRTGRPYRYGYATAFTGDPHGEVAIIRHDLRRVLVEAEVHFHGGHDRDGPTVFHSGFEGPGADRVNRTFVEAETQGAR